MERKIRQSDLKLVPPRLFPSKRRVKAEPVLTKGNSVHDKRDAQRRAKVKREKRLFADVRGVRADGQDTGSADLSRPSQSGRGRPAVPVSGIYAITSCCHQPSSAHFSIWTKPFPQGSLQTKRNRLTCSRSVECAIVFSQG